MYEKSNIILFNWRACTMNSSEGFLKSRRLRVQDNFYSKPVSADEMKCTFSGMNLVHFYETYNFRKSFKFFYLQVKCDMKITPKAYNNYN